MLFNKEDNVALRKLKLAAILNCVVQLNLASRENYILYIFEAKTELINQRELAKN